MNRTFQNTLPRGCAVYRKVHVRADSRDMRTDAPKPLEGGKAGTLQIPKPHANVEFYEAGNVDEFFPKR